MGEAPKVTGPQSRVARFVREAGAREDDDRIPIAIASEEPVERWFGLEVLECSPDAVDMARLRERGLPLCMDHDTTEQVGRVEDITIGSDRVMRGLARFSKSEDAQAVEEDVRDGIRTDISVGYAIDAMALESSDKDKGDTYRVTRWRPLEVSLVAVPADETVGVGRSDTIKDAAPAPVVTAMRARETPMEQDQERAAALTAERDRVAAIEHLSERFGMQDKRRSWISEGATVEDVRKQILDDSRVKAEAAEKVRNPDGLALSDKEQREYSLRLAIASMLEGKREGLAFEISDELAKRQPATRGGLLIPASLKAPQTRTGLVGTASLGGNLRFTEEGDFIEALRNAMILGKVGGRIFNGLSGNVAFPKQLTASTAYWLAEAGTVTNSDLTYGLVTLSPKTLMFSAGVTRQMLAQSSVDVENLIRADFIAQQARELDRVLIVGTSTSNEPTGINNTSSVGSVTVGTNGGALTWDLLSRMAPVVGIANGVIDDTASFLTNWKVAHAAKNIFKGTAGYMPVWDSSERPLDGYPVTLSTAVPSNLTKGTSTTICSELVFGGSFREVLLGFWNGGGVAEILVDPYSQKKLGIVEMTGYSLADIQFRHAESFAVLKDVTTTL